MSISKAVITTAGFGTRFLPITKTIQKEMLPILNRPLVDYVVEDLIKAGISEIIFVISEHNQQIKHFYQANPRLYHYLDQMGKKNQYEQVAHLHTQAQFTFIKQPDSELYGTAIPVKLCRHLLEHEDAFFVFMGDDFIYNNDGHSEAAGMIELFEKSDAGGLITVIERPSQDLHRYGVAQVKQQNGFTYLERLVEKPAPGTAPSNLSNISKYIFTPQVFELIDHQQLDPKSGELYITDTVEKLAQQSQVAIYQPQGEYLDGGHVSSWLQANLRVALDDPELHRQLESFYQTYFAGK